MVRTAPMIGWMEHPNSRTMAVTSATCSGGSRLPLGRIRGERRPCQIQARASTNKSAGAGELGRKGRARREGAFPAPERVVKADLEGVQEHPPGPPARHEGPVRREVPVGAVADDGKPPPRALDPQLVAAPRVGLEPDERDPCGALRGPHQG